MKFSVVITTWGCEPWLEECRASVRAAVAQYGKPVEVIEVCNGEGPGAARNEGLDRARGEYVMFVDGDDTISPDAFVRLQDVSADFVTFLPPEGDWRMDVPSERARTFSALVGNLLAWNAVWRREAIGDLRFPAWRNCEDLVWTAGAFARAKTVVGGAPSWYRHRVVETGLARSYSWRRLWESALATWSIARACRGAHAGLRTRVVLLRKLTMHFVLHVVAIVPKILK